MNIIFLDFDGVMVTSRYCSYLERQGLPECDSKGRPKFDPKCVRNLKYIIERTGADIVVSSDWKYIDSYKDLLNMWEERNLPGFLTDVTPNLSKHRGDEIDSWLMECGQYCNYVIIDDLPKDCFNNHQYDRLISINPMEGLTQIDADKAIKILLTYNSSLEE